MNTALVIIFLTFALALLLGVLASRGKKMDLEQWTVGGRGYGAIFVFLLMAGELYTTFTFLGGSGLAYGKGAPAYYVLVYPTLAYVLSYWLLPPIWRYARRHRLISQPHYFSHRYDSPTLGILVAVVGVVALVPYLALQLKGLGIIVSIASYGSISSNLAIWVGASVATAYVMVSGVHGSAWTAALKDIMILAVMAFLGIYLPWHYFGGIAPMFAAIDAAQPQLLAFPQTGQNIIWFQSTVILTAVGFFMWPHSFSSIYTSKEERVFRRNAVILPLYQLVLLFSAFVRFAAVLQVPGLKGTDIDLALFKLSIQTFPSWVVGLIGSAGVLTALVPASMILMAAATLLSHDIYKSVRRDATEQTVDRLARAFVPVVVLVAISVASSEGTMVALLLMGYNFVSQLFPSLMLSLLPNSRINKYGAFSGVLSGIIVVVAMTQGIISISSIFPSAPDYMQQVNVGFLALCMNFIMTYIASALSRKLLTAPV